MYTLFCLFCWCVGWVIAHQIHIPLAHQVIDSQTSDKIVSKGIVTYDYDEDITTYQGQNEADLTVGEGIYRVGILDEKSNKLCPTAFTKLV